jgi:pre-mRNA-splicing helicase BRR2
VLTANREGRPRGKEPTGEPETLAGRNIPKMGDRAAHTVPEELKKRQARYVQRSSQGPGQLVTLAVSVLGELVLTWPGSCRENVTQDQAPSKKARVQTVLEADKYGSYQPKSRETREAYAQLLQMVQSRLGDHPPEVLYGAAEEVLAVLKDDDKRVRLFTL